MKLSSEWTGTMLLPCTLDITRRQITNFAAGIPDNNPCYFDDTTGFGIVAPPTFPVALTWPVISHLDDYIASDDFPRAVLDTRVLYTEHLLIHRPVRPGDRLTLTGEIAAVLPHRAGTHLIVHIDALDSAGKPVFSEYAGIMLLNVTSDGDLPPQPLPRVPETDPDRLPAWISLLSVDPLAPYVFDSCSGIGLPLQAAPEFAQTAGLPGIIVQGTATLSLAIRELINNEAGKNPVSVQEIACTFTGMVQPGTDIEVCCMDMRQNRDATHIFFEVINAENKKAIRSGYMKIKGDEPPTGQPEGAA